MVGEISNVVPSVSGVGVRPMGAGASAAPPPAPVSQPARETPSLGDAVGRLNTAADLFNRSIRFELRGASDQLVVQVVDTANNKVIRTIPQEDALALSQRVQEFLGVLFDEII